MWNIPGPGIEPMSPALAGRFSTTGPQRKSSLDILRVTAHHSLDCLPVKCLVTSKLGSMAFCFFLQNNDAVFPQVCEDVTRLITILLQDSIYKTD